MSTHSLPRRLRTRDVLLRFVAGLALAVVLAALGLAVLLWPVLLAFLIPGLVLGLLIRFFLVRRRRHERDPVRTERQPSHHPRHSLLVLGALGLVFAAIAVYFGTNFATLGPSPVEKRTYRLPYQAILEFEDGGHWSGNERFTVNPDQVDEIVRSRIGTRLFRLRAAVPSDWEVVAERSGKRVRYLIERKYLSDSFDVPSWRPLTIVTSLPEPELSSEGLRYEVSPAEKSTVSLHAPERRILSTRPSSEASPEAGSRAAWVVSLDTSGVQPGVDIEIESDLARKLPQTWLGHDTVGLILAILGTLGLTLAVALGWGIRVLKWVFHRVADGDEPAPPKSVFRGKRSKSAALISYLEGKGLGGEDVQSIINLVLHEAQRFASEAIANTGDPTAGPKYHAAYRTYLNQGEPPLDAVYMALRSVDIPEGELDALDRTLDRATFAAEAAAAQAAAPA